MSHIIIKAYFVSVKDFNKIICLWLQVLNYITYILIINTYTQYIHTII